MLKKFIAAIMIALPALGFAQAKFGVVNSQAIIESLPETKEAAEQLDGVAKKYQEAFKEFQEELDKKYADFQAMGDDTPQVMKDRKMKDLQDLSNRMTEFRTTAETDMQRQQEQLFAPIQQKIHDAITAVGKEGSYTFIFENMVPVYTGESVVDVTPLVKTKLGVK
ncbi:MAG: OmpH family outer membrane protein [Muribaculaceae bacterium]|jgi:outer membrane protein|nr:OmpH family outer membrane protein [Muribaculaceae bacterium]